MTRIIDVGDVRWGRAERESARVARGVDDETRGGDVGDRRAEFLSRGARLRERFGSHSTVFAAQGVARARRRRRTRTSPGKMCTFIAPGACGVKKWRRISRRVWMRNPNRKRTETRGGVVAYAKEFDAKESLFKGSNFVFDARGSVPVGPENELPETSWCDGCRPVWRLSQSSSVRCHVVLIACDACGDTVYCCEGCREQTVKSRGVEKFKRRPCECDCFESRERRVAAPTSTSGLSRVSRRRAQTFRRRVECVLVSS